MPAPAAAVTKTTLSENSIVAPVLIGSGDQLPQAQFAVGGLRAELPGPAGRRPVAGFPFPQPAVEALQRVLHRHADGPVDLVGGPGGGDRRVTSQRAGSGDERAMRSQVVVFVKRGL